MAGQAVKAMPNAAYGESKGFEQIQKGAAMSGGAPQDPAGGGMKMPPITGLGAPTQRPDEPVTEGSPSGPGRGPESIGMARGPKQSSQMDANALAGYLPSLERTANMPGIPQSFVKFVRYIRTQADA